MHRFDQDISLQSKDPFIFKINVSDNWSINGVPNGGFILAILANAMLQHTEKKETPILTVSYLSKCLPGEAELRVDEISRSTQFNRLQARLLQEGDEKSRAAGTFVVKKDECFIERIEASLPDIAPLEECVEIPKLPRFSLYEHIEVKLDPRCAGWMDGNILEKSEQKGWIRFRNDRDFDITGLALAVDAFPPTVFASQGLIAWVPTLELSLNIRNIPETKWLKCVFRTRFINCGLLEEDGQIWDEKDRLIAISRQIAQFKKG